MNCNRLNDEKASRGHWLGVLPAARGRSRRAAQRIVRILHKMNRVAYNAVVRDKAPVPACNNNGPAGSPYFNEVSS